MIRLSEFAPGRFKHWARLAAESDYRRRRNEFVRLQNIPNGVATSTHLLGGAFELMDAESFLFTYNEIFEREIYRFETPNSSPFIIDGGANTGLSVLYFKKLFPASTIIAFEPDPDIFEVLKRNCHNFGLADVQLVQKALWVDDSTLQFVQDRGEAGHLRRPDEKASTVAVSACRLKHFLNRPVDFLKIDIEGAETVVLSDCADELQNVQKLFVEYHSFAHEGQTLDTLISVLSKAGFRLQFQPLNDVTRPFLPSTVKRDMDMQLNIFGIR